LKGIYALSWTIIKNRCMMHGQQNVKYVILVNIYLSAIKFMIL